MNVLSLFDGISCARYALELSNIKVNKYYCCEIDKYAIQISRKNWKDNIFLGNVKDFSNNELEIDLLIGGSPCQDLSIAKSNRKGLEGNKSSLFWEYIRIKNLVKPKYFILENVASMSSNDKNIISNTLNINPIMFDAALVSGQSRKRLFWTNINFSLPIDKNIYLKDILEDDVTILDKRFITKKGKSFCLTCTNAKQNPSIKQIQRCLNVGFKISFVKAKDNITDLSKYKSIIIDNIEYNVRKLSPIECERLQSLPDNYTSGIPITQRYNCLGNAFNCNVISHILNFI
jgi:DNA (cytosine-5)-methyltransferase 3A